MLLGRMDSATQLFARAAENVSQLEHIGRLLTDKHAQKFDQIKPLQPRVQKMKFRQLYLTDF